MDRRDFLKKSAAVAAVAAVPESLNIASAAEKALSVADGDSASSGKLIASAPCLQNYASTSMGVAFAVSDMANGYVEYSENEDFTDAVRVYGGGYRVTDMNKDIIKVRLTGLKPSTKYYYRIAADRINYVHGHSIHITGSEKDPKTYSFTTAGSAADAHFCVINDTHGVWNALSPSIDKIFQLAPSCVVWNGDAYSSSEDIETQKMVFFNPPIKRQDYAATIPYLLCCGNHDSRGLANRHLERAWMFRQPEERSSRDWDLGRNFAVRMGDIAMIGLDTAEDKLDENPLFCNCFNSAAYREAQVLWLKDALKRKEIASAPYLVAFCHIPLFSSDPTDNPGDVHPNDTDSKYRHNFAIWQRTCHDLWAPWLEKAGCQLIITAHVHSYRFDAPAADRKWAQITGGGPDMGSKTGFPTVIEGLTEGGRLKIRIHNIATSQVVDEFEFKPRKGKKTSK